MIVLFADCCTNTHSLTPSPSEQHSTREMSSLTHNTHTHTHARQTVSPVCRYLQRRVHTGLARSLAADMNSISRRIRSQLHATPSCRRRHRVSAHIRSMRNSRVLTCCHDCVCSRMPQRIRVVFLCVPRTMAPMRCGDATRPRRGIAPVWCGTI